MSRPPLITLTTDFGLKDPWVGTMKGVILSINPEACVVDLTHLVSAHNIVEAALLLAGSYRFFPGGTIHVAVVDPGVGGRRRPIVVETEDYLFVGPDNGLFTMALRNERVKRIIHITKKEYMLPAVSHTFHGRDIFAPVAAHLSKGVSPQKVGSPVADLQRVEVALPAVKGDRIEGEVIHVDTFGNLITNIEEAALEGADPRSLKVELEGVTIEGLSESYEEGRTRRAIAIVGSTGYLEIACYMKRAEEVLQTTVGQKVVVRR